MTARFRAMMLGPAVAVILLSTGCATGGGSGATATTSASTATPTASASPTPTPTASTAPPPVAATCDAILTPAFAADVAGNGWVSWTLPRNGVGGSPFDLFPGGAPAGSISCRYGADPDLATDNVFDLAWSPAVDDPAATQAALVAAGFVTLDSPDGTVLARPGEAGTYPDTDGYADAFLFTADDIRWAPLREYLAYVQDPQVG